MVRVQGQWSIRHFDGQTQNIPDGLFTNATLKQFIISLNKTKNDYKANVNKLTSPVLVCLYQTIQWSTINHGPYTSSLNPYFHYIHIHNLNLHPIPSTFNLQPSTFKLLLNLFANSEPWTSKLSLFTSAVAPNASSPSASCPVGNNVTCNTSNG